MRRKTTNETYKDRERETDEERRKGWKEEKQTN